MSRVFLFGDESGIMPADDGDGPFCVATVATTDDPPTLTRRSGHVGDLALAFEDIECVPHVVFVRPGTGYGAQVRRKTSKMNTMARATRLMTGSNEYLPNYGQHNLRNTVWMRCMAVALIRTVVLSARPTPIDAVSIILDRKSMAAPSKRLFVDRIRSMDEDILGSGVGVEVGTQAGVDIRSHIRFGRDEISVFWSDEVSSSDFEDGLFLVHNLSGLAKSALETGTETKLARDLSTEFDELFYDATLDVVRPLSTAAIERWKGRTGLPEPSE